MEIAIIGGGAAGFFAAINGAEWNPDCNITIFERGKNVLEKVRVSGGGRCNVTHACFDARELCGHYPRGSRELLGPFMQFGPADTIEWFARRGVVLKTESDGRMFPQTDDAQTIIDCFERSAARAGVRVRTGARVEGIKPLPDGRWQLSIGGQAAGPFDKLMLATGSSTGVWEWLAQLGHQIVPPVPSLFTFNTKDTRLRDLSGVSVPSVQINAPELKWQSSGPLLITHWGLSGPAVLRLSAWGARAFASVNYKFHIDVNFTGAGHNELQCSEVLQELRQTQGKKSVQGTAPYVLPLRLWQHLTEAAGIAPQQRWADLRKQDIQALARQLTVAQFQITGKSTFKEEFVTAGGVSLKEVNFKTFESRLLPNLYLAGEVLDIDAITGGFNFQAAWTGGYLVAKAMVAEK